MTTLTFDINDDTYHTAQVLARHKKMTLAELFSFFVQKESEPSPENTHDFKAIEALGGCLAEYAKNKPTLTDEEIDTLARKKFAEKWVANESH